MIDAHVHFWEYEPVKDAWIADHMAAIKGDFMPPDLEVELKLNEVNGCVAVQADQSENETKFLLAQAEQYPFIKGVVGWIDFRSQQLPERLAFFADNNKLKGWRHIVQAEPKGFLNQSDFLRGISELEQYGHTYDILINQQQLPEVIDFVWKFPEQKFVLDHIAKPAIANQKKREEWAMGIELLAQHKNVYCKVSGLVTEADWNNWVYEDMIYYLETVFEHFGAHRLMFGSDWPVCTLATNYKNTKQIVETFAAQLTVEQQRAIFETTAMRCYNL